METNEKKERYSDAELEEFKALILEKIAKAERDLEIIRGTYLNHAGNGTEDTSPTFKPFEEGSETMSKEANAQLAARQEKFIRDLRNALVRIENKTYGICRVTGKLHFQRAPDGSSACDLVDRGEEAALVKFRQNRAADTCDGLLSMRSKPSHAYKRADFSVFFA